MRDLYSFPEGFAETMTGPDIRLVYPTLPEEVHNIVGFMLETSGEQLPVWHSRLDTPILAIQALKTHVGRTLPTYDHLTLPRVIPTGETRTIEKDDLFTIVDGPTRTVASYTVFTTKLERVTEQTVAERTGTYALQKLFGLTAASR